jgi:hypothetical protein
LNSLSTKAENLVALAFACKDAKGLV